MQCPPIPNKSYREFSENLRLKTQAGRIPLNGSLELTQRCNLNCLHCYCIQKNAAKELSTEKIKSLLDEMARAGCLWLLITGGEPLLREDFSQIYLHAKRCGFLINLYTNGTLIDDEKIRLFKEYPPYSIEITLYGAKKQTYETITGVEGSFDRCIDSINSLIKHNLPVQLKTIAMTINKDEVFQIKDFAKKQGLLFRFDPDITPRLDNSKHALKFRLTPREVLCLDKEDKDRKAEWQRHIEESMEPYPGDELFVCGAGRNMFHIDSYGKMSLCLGASNISFSLAECSFDEVWNRYFPEILSLKADPNNPCLKCELVSVCNNCPGASYLENKDMNKPVAYLCELAHLRLKEFGIRARNKVLV